MRKFGILRTQIAILPLNVLLRTPISLSCPSSHTYGLGAVCEQIWRRFWSNGHADRSTCKERLRSCGVCAIALPNDVKRTVALPHSGCTVRRHSRPRSGEIITAIRIRIVYGARDRCARSFLYNKHFQPLSQSLLAHLARAQKFSKTNVSRLSGAIVPRFRKNVHFDSSRRWASIDCFVGST